MVTQKEMDRHKLVEHSPSKAHLMGGMTEPRKKQPPKTIHTLKLSAVGSDLFQQLRELRGVGRSALIELLLREEAARCKIRPNGSA